MGWNPARDVANWFENPLGPLTDSFKFLINPVGAVWERQRKYMRHKESDAYNKMMAGMASMRPSKMANYPIWEAIARQRRKGALTSANKTILTSPLGLMGQGMGQRKTLLGQ